jgi:hypothetical protein
VNLPKIFREEHRAPVVLAAAITFVAWNAFGFGWLGLPSLGFVTSGAAEQLAVAKMEKVAVPLAAQLCAIKFNEQSASVVAAKQAKLKTANYTVARTEQLDKAWVTLGDARDANQKVVDACADLILTTVPNKSAELAK